MKILISLSAKKTKDTDYLTGDRVAYREEKGVWFLGTVSALRKKTVYIKLDNGDERECPQGSQILKKTLLKEAKDADPLNEHEVKPVVDKANPRKDSVSVGAIARRVTKSIRKYDPKIKGTSDINNGDCYKWAYTFFSLVKGAKLYTLSFEGTDHAIVQVGGRFYDATHPTGVTKISNLKYYEQAIELSDWVRVHKESEDHYLKVWRLDQDEINHLIQEVQQTK